MLKKTYTKIIDLFRKNHGYMSFEQLRENDVTVLQMRELEEEGILHRFTRGWYWCSACGLEKPADYKYIEIAKMNPDAVICLDSACFLNKLSVREPEVVQVATARGDRRKMEIDFPIRRYFLTHLDIGKHIQVKKTEFGSYRYFSMERALHDCMHALHKVSAHNTEAIRLEYAKHKERVDKYELFFRKYKRSVQT
ncbi:MAG: hypothetical protein J5518_12340 [Lachnospiraceae bacterium]|nr:hypothetical protein [Lachnospiraceae bacterium]